MQGPSRLGSREKRECGFEKQLSGLRDAQARGVQAHPARARGTKAGRARQAIGACDARCLEFRRRFSRRAPRCVLARLLLDLWREPATNRFAHAKFEMDG
jgi:hypothetical protein